VLARKAKHEELDRPVSPDDIKAKLSEIDGSFQSTAKAAAPIGLAVGAAVVLGVVILAYAFGRRRGAKRRTVVEIRRI
jgi:hypothetical protein